MMRRQRQRGLSLIELMVSLTLGLIVLSGVLVVFVNSSAARNEVERTTRQIENGRYASELLSEDLRVAGFYGQLDPTSIPTPTDVPGTMGTDICSITPSQWSAWIPVHIQGYDASNLSSTICPISDYKTGTDILVIRRARTCSSNATTCTPDVTAGTPYLQVSLCPSQMTTTQYVLGLWPTAAPGSFTMMTKACDTATLASKREYYVHIYYISTNNGSGVSIPTLKRLELVRDPSNTAQPKWDTVSLVEGIENMQFLYGVDNGGGCPPTLPTVPITCADGVPDEYVANPGSADRWNHVVTVQFYILARNLESSPNYTDTKTYALGKDSSNAAITYTPSGSDVNYRRHVYSGLVRIMNPAGRRDAP